MQIHKCCEHALLILTERFAKRVPNHMVNLLRNVMVIVESTVGSKENIPSIGYNLTQQNWVEKFTSSLGKRFKQQLSKH